MCLSAYSDWISLNVLFLRNPVTLWSCYISTRSALTVLNNFVSLAAGSVTWVFVHFFCQSSIHGTQYTSELIMYLYQGFPSGQDLSGRGLSCVQGLSALPLFRLLKTLEASYLLSWISDNLGSIFYALNHVNTNFIANAVFTYSTWAGSSREYSGWHEKQFSCVVCQKSKEEKKSKKFNSHFCTCTFIFSCLAFSFGTYGLSF